MAVIMIVTLTVSLSAYALTTQEKINQKEQEKKQTQQNSKNNKRNAGSNAGAADRHIKK